MFIALCKNIGASPLKVQKGTKKEQENILTSLN